MSRLTDRWTLFLAGVGLVFAGALIAHLVQTADGITVKDLRFSGAGGKTLSALLYIPRDAMPENKAPAILAVHGYMNSREVQSGFAIEYARRGYVVMALDQAGHGYSQGPAFADGFGGPAALNYLRQLDFVDVDNIGLEGHSMGGWTVLAAAAAMPDGYRAMVLEGSSTGAPFAAPGTATWPRNTAVVFAQYDEFSDTMWGVARGVDVASSAKLKALFDTRDPVVADRNYGDIDLGTGRALFQPAVTHAGNHLSPAAIGYSIDWFATTLSGGRPLVSTDQTWLVKEFGTWLALVGFVVLLLGAVKGLLASAAFSSLRAVPDHFAYQTRSSMWWLAALLTAVIPVVTFYPAFKLAEIVLPASAWLPQSITNQIAFWAVLNGVISLVIGRVLPGQPIPSNERPWRSLCLAASVIALGYIAVSLVDAFAKVDLRFWFVGIKVMNTTQFQYALVYAAPLTIFTLLTSRALHLTLSVRGVGAWGVYATNGLLLAGGFALLLLAQYGALFVYGQLLTPGEPLNTILMIQFVPILLILSVVSTFSYLQTARYFPGALINGLFLAWYVTAGQAFQHGVGI